MPTHSSQLVTLVRARRWMTVGLVVSILGTRTIEGGSDGLVAISVLPVAWVAILTSTGEMISFASPLLASIFRRFSPAKVLVSSDLAEALISGAALLMMFVFPGLTVPILIVYLLIAAVFPAVTDVVEEFYGQQLAQLQTTQALAFNTSVYSALAFVGLVIAMPFGSVLAGLSVPTLIGANLVLSALGTIFRLVSAKTVVTSPLTKKDVVEESALGERMPIADFISDMWRTGVTSPLSGFLTQVGATIGGVFVYLAFAQMAPFSSATAFAITVASFGLGATVGPWVGRYLSNHFELRALSIALLSATGIFALFAAAATLWLAAPSTWWLGALYAFLLGILARARAVAVTTLRQTRYQGTRFARVMSWTFATTAAGAIVGSWVAVWSHSSEHPSIALVLFAAFVFLSVLSGLSDGRWRTAS